MSQHRTAAYNYLRSIQPLYFVRQLLADPDYRKNWRDMRNAKKPREQIKAEMALLKNYWHCLPYHYIRYRLYDRQLTDEELLSYIPPYHFYNRHLPKVQQDLDRRQYSGKLRQAKVFAAKGVPSPAVVATVVRGSVADADGQPTTMDTILSTLADGGKMFFKPDGGKGGTGIVVVKRCGDRLLMEGREVSAGDILQALKADTYIAQHGIRQCEALSAINPTSVNTLRTMTQFFSTDSEPRLCACILRMGRNGKDVDNSHQGGMSIEIDNTTGRFVGKATAEHGGGLFERHPDSGYAFEGQGIPNWEEVRRFMVETASKFPDLHELAWDFALSEEGPLVIEMNLSYGLDFIQCVCGGVRDALRVYPDE